MKRKGFTLIELLVAMASALIILITLTSSVYFISKVSNEVIIDSTNNIKLRTVRDYIYQNKIDDDSLITIEENDIIYNSKTIASDTNISNITITYDSILDIYKCSIYFNYKKEVDHITFSYKK